MVLDFHINTGAGLGAEKPKRFAGRDLFGNREIANGRGLIEWWGIVSSGPNKSNLLFVT
jgi:hypothetical protein